MRLELAALTISSQSCLVKKTWEFWGPSVVGPMARPDCHNQSQFMTFMSPRQVGLFRYEDSVCWRSYVFGSVFGCCVQLRSWRWHFLGVHSLMSPEHYQDCSWLRRCGKLLGSSVLKMKDPTNELINFRPAVSTDIGATVRVLTADAFVSTAWLTSCATARSCVVLVVHDIVVEIRHMLSHFVVCD